MATFLVFNFHFNNKSTPSLKVPLVIEGRKRVWKQPDAEAPRNLENIFVLKLPEDLAKFLTTLFLQNTSG